METLRFMNKYLPLAILLLCCLSSSAKFPPGPAGVKVYFFLREDCLVSQYYTLTINELHQQYASQQLVFEGVFPNESSTELGVAVFKEKYNISFPLKLDVNQELTQKFSAKITPEVVVYDSGRDKVVYQGRIDNSYVRVGKRRRVVSQTELKDVLLALQCGDDSEFERTEAVGCFIQLGQ